MTEFKIPKIVTINEAAQLTGLARYFIRQLCLKNQIYYLKAGKKFLINLDKLVEYLNPDIEKDIIPAIEQTKIKKMEVLNDKK